MCHSNDSRPPDAPRHGAVAEEGEGHLTSADGTRFMTYGARPADPHRHAGIVVLPDARGLHGFYKSLAGKLAGAGYQTVAIDYFGRVLPDGPREDGMEVTMPLIMQLRPEQVAEDIRAAVDELFAAGCQQVFSLGFCYGGSQSWNQSAFDDRIAGSIGFYGRPDDCRPFLDRIRGPLLVLAAGADMLTSPEDNARWDAELTEAGVAHEMTLYDGAPHSFFDAAPGFEAAASDAWERVLAFLDTHSGAAAAV